MLLIRFILHLLYLFGPVINNMQKLYKVAFQRVLSKLGGEKLQSVNIEGIKALLKETKIPLSQIDETIFHKLPRDQVKNFLRNPCPINNAQQTQTQIVTSAKLVRGALNISQKKVCFKCVFVSTCSKAFIEPAGDFIIQNPLQNLLLTMKNVSQLEEQAKFKTRSWFSAVRVCDSLSSVVDDLIAGGEEFKAFKAERNTYKESSEALGQSQQQVDQRQLLGLAKKNKVPLKQIYAQIPSSKKPERRQESDGQQAFEELTKGPQNIFKKKRSEQFIKIAQKHAGGDAPQQSGQGRQVKKYNNDRQDRPQRQSDRGYKGQSKRFQKNRNFDRQNRYPRDQVQGRQNYRGNRQNFNNRQVRSFREDKFQNKNVRGDQFQNRNFRQNKFQNKFQNRSYNGQKRNNQRYNNDRNQPKSYERNGQQQFRRSNDSKYPRDNQFRRQSNQGQNEQGNPRIRRFTKQNKPERQDNQYKGDRGTDRTGKFYTPMREQMSDQQQVLSNLNRREYTPKYDKLPRDGRFNQQQPPNEKGRSDNLSKREHTQIDMKQFERMQRIPKILKTQYASKQDIKQRVQQQSSQSQTQRKGRRIKRV